MPSDSPIILTTAPSASHAAQIIYGLDLRGFNAQIINNPLKTKDKPKPKIKDPHAIILTKGDQTLAKAAIESIWDTLLESTPRATDINNNCYFCGYDITGLIPPAICPECGQELDTIKARRAASENWLE